MFHHILVPLDQSTYAERALLYARDLSNTSQTKISLLAIVDGLDDELASPELQRAAEIRMQRAQLYLDKRADAERAAGTENVDSHLRSGEPAAAIVDVAREIDADLIVMSTHGSGARGRHALGSVAQKVLVSPPCPILTVPIAEETH